MAKKQSEGLDIPAETQTLPPLPPGLRLKEHPAAALFPMLVGADADDFNQDIRVHGVAVPVTLIDVANDKGDIERQILDGRNRRRAAKLAGQSCPAELYTGKTPVHFVIAHNLRRRHLNESQRSALAASLEGLTHGGKRFGGKADAEPAITRDEAAAMTGSSVRSVARASKVMRKAPDLFNAVQAGQIPVSAAAQAVDLPTADQKKVIEEISAGRAKTAKQVVKRGRVKLRNDKLKAKIVADPTRKYAVLVSDDEWSHLTWSEQGQDRAAVMHYNVSDAEELYKRVLPAADNAVYYMWTTVPHSPLAYDLMKHRGFTFRSEFAWWKIYPGTKPGLGYWSRIEHEKLLIGTRGDIACPAPGDNWRSVQLSFVGEHSEKPEWAFRMIESYHRGLVGTMMEFNARKRRRGWSAWGNEIGLIEPPYAELEAEFAAAPVLPDADYIEVDRAVFHAMRKPELPLAPLAAAEPPSVAGHAGEEAPENPDLRALWFIEAGRVGEVAAPDLKRVIAAGLVTPGRAKRKKGDSRPALLSAHGMADLKAWRQRVADDAGFDTVEHPPTVGAERVNGAPDLSERSRERPAAPAAEAEGDFKPPAFLLAESAERKSATKKRDSRRGAAE